MAQMLYRLGKWSFHAKWAVIIGWVLILAIFGGLAATLQRGFVDTFTIGGTPSQTAFDVYKKNFPDSRNPLEGTGITIVFEAPAGQRLDTPENTAAMQRVIEKIDTELAGKLVNTERWGNPVALDPLLQQGVIQQSIAQGIPAEQVTADAANLALVSTDKKVAYTVFELDYEQTADITESDRAAISQALELGREQGLKVNATGAGFAEPIEINEVSEIIGIAVAALILVFTLGSLVAAGLPIVIAVIGVAVGALGTVTATALLDMNNVTPVLAVMLGLAVGIDYSLFIVFRYRRELRTKSRAEAAGIAVGTAGSAVVFAGLTVIVALAALAVANITFLTYMGLAAAFTVLVAVLIALTLVPACLAALGGKVFAAQIKPLAAREAAHTGSGGARWIRFVQKRPALVAGTVVLLLAALTVPAARLHLSLPTDTQADHASTQRKAADTLAEAFGAGINSPLLVVVDTENLKPESAPIVAILETQTARAQQQLAAQIAADPALADTLSEQQAAAQPAPEQLLAGAAFQYVMQQYAQLPGVKHIQTVAVSKDGRAAQMLLTPETAPEDTATNDLITALREKQAEVSAQTGVFAGVTGHVPIQQDITNRLAGVMGLYLAIVVGLAIVLLMIVFRSLLVPLIAGAGFLLSVGAAFGVTVLFWQEGLWGLVATPGPIIAFMPIFLIGVCFGLAMDYQVFIVSGMREHFVHSLTALPLRQRVSASIVQGFTSSARVVTAAALIMIAVFIAFIWQPLPFIKVFGFGLGMGVLFDAFLVRMAFMPAVMLLMGKATWWMPAWLDKILPRVDVEGAALQDLQR